MYWFQMNTYIMNWTLEFNIFIYIQWNPFGKVRQVSLKLQNLSHFLAPFFTNHVYIPLRTGHLFWKATILGGFYRGVPLYIFIWSLLKPDVLWILFNDVQSSGDKTWWKINLQKILRILPHRQVMEYLLWGFREKKHVLTALYCIILGVKMAISNHWCR